MGISKRNPKGNFNWQNRILKRRAICCGQLNEPVDCDLFGPTLQIIGNNICKPSVSPTNQTVSVANTQPGQASTTSYEWYEGGPGGPLYYSSYGGSDSSIEFTVAQQVLGTTTFWIVVTNSLGCVTSQYLNIYVSNQPDVSITQSDPTDPCVADPGNPFGQSSNGIISVTVNNPDPNALYYGYVIRKNNIEYETTDPLDTFSWTDLCYGTYTVKINLYRLIDGIPTVVCSTGFIPIRLGALILEWDNIANVPVANPADVSQWNAWFFGAPNFTSVTVAGNSVYLRGNTLSVLMHASNWNGNANIVAIIDQGGYVTSIDNFALQNCSSLLLLDFLQISNAGSYACGNNASLTDVYFRSLAGGPNMADNVFDSCSSLNIIYIPGAVLSTGNNIFNNVIGSTITVTADSVYQSPLDANLAYLNANNTVTFIWV